MNNALFLYNTAFDSAALSADPAGAVDSNWPLANLQDTIRRRVLKTTGTGNITIQIDFGAPLACSALALVEYDLKPATPVIVRAFSDEYVTQTLEAEFEAIGPVQGWKEGGWKTFGWYGYPSEADLAEYPRPTSLFLFDSTYAQYWTIEIQNGSDAGDAFFLGRVLLGLLWEPLRNFSVGYKMELVDDSEVHVSLGGVKHTNIGEQYWRMTISLDSLQDHELFDGWLRFAKGVGRRKDFVVQLLDSTIKHQRMTTLYGRLTKSPAATNKRANKNATSFIIEESV